MRIKTEVCEIFTIGMRGYLSKRKSTTQVKKVKKEKPAEREMLTAGVVCPMRFERTTFRVGV
jgi:hypothetical protein